MAEDSCAKAEKSNLRISHLVGVRFILRTARNPSKCTSLLTYLQSTLEKFLELFYPLKTKYLPVPSIPNSTSLQTYMMNHSMALIIGVTASHANNIQYLYMTEDS